MPVTIKSPNADEIFDAYKQKAPKKDLEKAYGVKGAVFNIDQITAAEYVQNVQKGCVLYFQYKEGAKASKEAAEELYTDPSKVGGITFYDFGTANVQRSSWKKKDDTVPGYKTLKEASCDKCGGNGYTACDCKNTGIQKCSKCDGKGVMQCNTCKGEGTLSTDISVIDAQGAKKNVSKSYNCPDCFGNGTRLCTDCDGTGKVLCSKCKGMKGLPCKECGGTGIYYSYTMIPVPFKSASGLEDAIFPSLKLGKFEKEMGKELEEILPQTDAITVKKIEDLTQKIIEPNLGYFDGAIKTAMGACQKQFKTLEKTPGTKPQLPVWVFPLLILDCKTKKGTTFQVYAIGTEQSFVCKGTL